MQDTTIMMKNNIKIYTKNFILCGIIGWCLECFWTGFSSFCKKDKELTCHTSYWMFPIYGLAAFIDPLHQCMRNLPLFLRGTIYTALIYVVEFTTGCLLGLFHACPWNYSKAKYNLNGVIRLDYLPAWFGMGLLYEKLLEASTRYFKTGKQAETTHR